MPYITPSERPQYQDDINDIVDKLMAESIHSNNTAKGHLNYIITAIIKRFLKRTGMNYASAQDFIGGVLTCCQLELYRKMLAPYEDEKEEQNGGVK